MCLPVQNLDAWRDHAERVVEASEDCWPLVQSAAPPHGDDARQGLLDAGTVAPPLVSPSTAPDEAGDIGS